MTGPTKVLVLALDACDRSIALRMAQQGRMPNLQSLLDRGTSGTIYNPPGLFVGSVWPTLYTGTSPGTHGRYCFRQYQPGTYEVRPTNVAHDVRALPFWEHLSQVGRRVAILDVPHSAVSEGLNGIQLVDWGAHDANPGFRVWPPSLEQEVRSLPAHPVGVDCNGDRRDPDDFSLLSDNLLHGVKLRTQMVSSFLGQGGWDLFFHAFSEAHCVGHQCWHLHDPSHPRFREELQAAGDPLDVVYMALDRAVGELVSLAGPDATVMVLLSHGMGAHFGGNHLLDPVLRRLELSGLPKVVRDAVDITDRAFDAAPWKFRRRALRLAGRHPGPYEWRRAGFEPYLFLTDGRHRRYFAVPNNDVYGGIRINVKGREPRGLVSPGAELDDIHESIERGLLGLVNVATGEPVVHQVMHTRELFSGPLLDSLPDLLVEWNWSAPIEVVASPRIGTISVNDTETRTGDHRPPGFFVAAGPGVTPGRLDRPVASVDVAPTMCALLGTELPHAEGRPISTIAGSATTATAAP
jgi:predicted AlkP superfamily phosphohydrolase/phosphomutase